LNKKKLRFVGNTLLEGVCIRHDTYEGGFMHVYHSIMTFLMQI